MIHSQYASEHYICAPRNYLTVKGDPYLESRTLVRQPTPSKLPRSALQSTKECGGILTASESLTHFRRVTSQLHLEYIDQVYKPVSCQIDCRFAIKED
jgi:hypothetical protein